MKTNRFSLGALILAAAAVSLGAGESFAQTGTMRECGGASKGTCVEVTLRYHANKNIQILDPKTGQEIPTCQFCDPKDKSCTNPCKGTLGTNLLDANGITLMQTRTNPHCYTIIIGGWPRQYCPPH